MKLRVPLDDLAAGERELSRESAAYVARVHRLGVGDAFLAFDPAAAIEADATIASVDRRVVVVLGEPRAALRPARAITLLQGLPKADKMDAIVRDATELGATRVVPVRAARSVADPSDARVDRWRRIAVEAARQSGRGDAPRVDPIANLEAALEGVDSEVRLALDPRGDTTLARVIERVASSTSVAFLVGPEGGLDPDELARAERQGFARVSLGPIVLRTETACAALLGALLTRG